MRTILSLIVALSTSQALAGKVPLRPDELEAQAEVIVTGTVNAHVNSEATNRDGSRTIYVYLQVQPDAVEKGHSEVTPEEIIEALCWTVVRPPRKGSLWDAGHESIPAEGSRARFYLHSKSSNCWKVIYPNGIERLDDGPTLQYPMEPPEPEPSLATAVIGGGLAFLFASAIFVWLFVSPPRRQQPNDRR
jgi:hypothetical protein